MMHYKMRFDRILVTFLQNVLTFFKKLNPIVTQLLCRSISQMTIFCFAVMFIVLGLAPSVKLAEAFTQNYTFNGTITRTGTSLIPIGSNFSGSFSIDLDTPLAYTSVQANSYFALLNFDASINGYDFQFTPAIKPIYVSGASIYAADIPGSGSSSDLQGRSCDFGFGFLNSISCADHSLGNALDLNLQSFLSQYFYADIFGFGGHYQTEVGGNILSIEPSSNGDPVPEPGTIFLIISGLAATLWYNTWRRAKVVS